MKKINYFFARKEFEDDGVKRPFYEYLGYFHINPDGTKNYPVFLYFGRDELSICFKDAVHGNVHKVFSLYVVEGELNQKRLSSQIENYWKMPLWPLDRSINDICSDKDIKGDDGSSGSNDKGDKFFYLETGSLCKYIGIDIADNTFYKIMRFSSQKDVFNYRNSKGKECIDFFYKEKSRDTDGEWEIGEKWEIQDGKVITNKINFRKILLDFLFEIEFANTFEDENFFSLQKALKNNRIIDAMIRKLCYLIELNKICCKQPIFPNGREPSSAERTEGSCWLGNIFRALKTKWGGTGPSARTHKILLSRRFRRAEKQWLNVCFLEDYKEVFESRNSIFDSPENEAKLVLFKTQIRKGDSCRSRAELFDKNDTHLRNMAASFFLRRYSIFNAFHTLLSPLFVWLIPMLFLLTPLGDFCLGNIGHNNVKSWVGVSSIGMPMVLFFIMIVRYFCTGINLFKLLLPRLFLGILLGWSFFWSSEELWKAAFTAHASQILVVDLCLFALIFLYVFTDIRNKLFNADNKTVIGRTTVLLMFAIVMSFVQGFYVLQFKAKPLLENSGFLKSPQVCESQEILNKFPDDVPDDIRILEEAPKQRKRQIWHVKNFSSPAVFESISLFKDIKLYYIWSIHFSQLMMAILIGIVFQLLWEDRPITEPL